MFEPDANGATLLAEVLRGEVLADFVEFYRHCNGFSLPRVGGGYFFDGATEIYQDIKAGGEPIYVSDRESVPVVTFARDGGGGAFTLCIEGAPAVLYLHNEGSLRNSVWQPSSYRDQIFGSEVVATTFMAFLDRLLDDVNAAARQEKGWRFMAR